MKDFKVKPAVIEAAHGTPPHKLLIADEWIEEVGKKALEAAQRAEELESVKREADKKGRNAASKVAT